MNTPTLVLVTSPAIGADSADGPGFARADPAEAHIVVAELGLSRGDGFFETIGVSHGRPLSLEPHLRRFAHSARLLEIPEPDLDVWRAAVLTAIEAHEPAAELSAKLVMTRGIAGSEQPTGWVLVEHAPDFTAARTAGIRVVTLDRGVRHDAAQTAPWLLLGAKTLSYATNMAALREASRRDADDVIFLSSDGYVLEGPTSNVILRHGETVSTPATELGILAGTTQARAFDIFAARGIRTEYALLEAEKLQTADAAWLVSSVRQAAPVRAIDGRELGIDAELSRALNEGLLSGAVPVVE